MTDDTIQRQANRFSLMLREDAEAQNYKPCEITGLLPQDEYDCADFIDALTARIAELEAERDRLRDEEAAFARVWAVVRRWDVSTEPGSHRLYESINGDHVRAIVRAALNEGGGNE